jgi:hypothetical protein
MYEALSKSENITESRLPLAMRSQIPGEINADITRIGFIELLFQK